jgi:hypothetical protein
MHTKSWGYKQEDGTFDGMIGALVRKEADVGGSSIFFRAERHEGKIIFHFLTHCLLALARGERFLSNT